MLSQANLGVETGNYLAEACEDGARMRTFPLSAVLLCTAIIRSFLVLLGGIFILFQMFDAASCTLLMAIYLLLCEWKK